MRATTEIPPENTVEQAYWMLKRRKLSSQTTVVEQKRRLDATGVPIAYTEQHRMTGHRGAPWLRL